MDKDTFMGWGEPMYAMCARSVVIIVNLMYTLTHTHRHQREK